MFWVTIQLTYGVYNCGHVPYIRVVDLRGEVEVVVVVKRERPATQRPEVVVQVLEQNTTVSFLNYSNKTLRTVVIYFFSNM